MLPSKQYFDHPIANHLNIHSGQILSSSSITPRRSADFPHLSKIPKIFIRLAVRAYVVAIVIAKNATSKNSRSHKLYVCWRQNGSQLACVIQSNWFGKLCRSNLPKQPAEQTTNRTRKSFAFWTPRGVYVILFGIESDKVEAKEPVVDEFRTIVCATWSIN